MCCTFCCLLAHCTKRQNEPGRIIEEATRCEKGMGQLVVRLNDDDDDDDGDDHDDDIDDDYDLFYAA